MSQNGRVGWIVDLSYKAHKMTSIISLLSLYSCTCFLLCLLEDKYLVKVEVYLRNVLTLQ